MKRCSEAPTAAKFSRASAREFGSGRESTKPLIPGEPRSLNLLDQARCAASCAGERLQGLVRIDQSISCNDHQLWSCDHQLWKEVAAAACPWILLAQPIRDNLDCVLLGSELDSDDCVDTTKSRDQRRGLRSCHSLLEKYGERTSLHGRRFSPNGALNDLKGLLSGRFVAPGVGPKHESCATGEKDSDGYRDNPHVWQTVSLRARARSDLKG